MKIISKWMLQEKEIVTFNLLSQNVQKAVSTKEVGCEQAMDANE